VLPNNLIVEFYRAFEKKSSLVAIPSISIAILFSTRPNRDAGKKENETTYLVYCNTFINLLALLLPWWRFSA
jgi:uncharacterized protein (DUF2225 family)